MIAQSTHSAHNLYITSTDARPGGTGNTGENIMTSKQFYSMKPAGECRYVWLRKKGLFPVRGEAYASFSRVVDGVTVTFTPEDNKFGKGYRVFARGGMIGAFNIAGALAGAREMLRLQDAR